MTLTLVRVDNETQICGYHGNKHSFNENKAISCDYRQ